MKKPLESPAVMAMVERVNFEKSIAMRPKVHDTNPGVTHTYAK